MHLLQGCSNNIKILSESIIATPSSPNPLPKKRKEFGTEKFLSHMATYSVPIHEHGQPKKKTKFIRTLRPRKTSMAPIVENAHKARAKAHYTDGYGIFRGPQNRKATKTLHFEVHPKPRRQKCLWSNPWKMYVEIKIQRPNNGHRGSNVELPAKLFSSPR